MPELPICDENGELLEGAIGQVWSLMSHPTDEEAQAKKYLAFLFEVVYRNTDEKERREFFASDPQALEALVTYPELGSAEGRAKLQKSPLALGLLVGEMLAALLWACPDSVDSLGVTGFQTSLPGSTAVAPSSRTSIFRMFSAGFPQLFTQIALRSCSNCIGLR